MTAFARTEPRLREGIIESGRRSVGSNPAGCIALSRMAGIGAISPLPHASAIGRIWPLSGHLRHVRSMARSGGFRPFSRRLRTAGAARETRSTRLLASLRESRWPSFQPLRVSRCPGSACSITVSLTVRCRNAWVLGRLTGRNRTRGRTRPSAQSVLHELRFGISECTGATIPRDRLNPITTNSS